MNQRGFTLIEVIVALVIFAILASMTSYVLFQSFDTDNSLKKESTNLNTLKMAITLLRRDTEQIINRPIVGDQQRTIKSFIGQTRYVEFTRSGAINPDAIEQRSSLKRIAYLCKGPHLVRRSWTVLDSIDRNHYHDTIVLTDLQDCSFYYLDQKHLSSPNWIGAFSDQTHQNSVFPTSVTCHLSIEKWGTLDISLIIPVGLYV